MASTIITKNGTGSAVPTSLQQGELAINVSSGQLYYGTSASGSMDASVSSSFTFTSVSASGTISASKFHGDGSDLSNVSSTPPAGTISSSLQVFTALTASGNITGSTIEGQTLIADVFLSAPSASITNLTNTNITSSGNISSSGTVFTTNIATPDVPSGNQTGVPITIKAGRGFGSGATAGALFLRTSQGMGTGLGGDITLQPGGGGSAVPVRSGSINLNSTKININGPVTASGDISASGQFVGANFGLDSTDKLQFSDGTLQFRIGDGSRITHTSTIFRPTSDEGVSLGRTAEKWKELVVNHITASSNISSSGTIHADQYNVDGYIALNTDGSTQGRVFSDATITSIQIGRNGSPTKNIELLGPVTASGNISSSGNIFGDQYKTKGQTLGLYHEASSTIRLADSSEKTEIYGTNIELKAPVTASGNISSSGNVTANNFIGAPIQLVTHAWYSIYSSGGDVDWGLDKLTNGDDNFGWADRVWDNAIDKSDVPDNGAISTSGTFTHQQFNKGFRINHNVTDIELIGVLRPNSSVTELNYYIYKGTPFNGGTSSTITFLASASSATTTTSRPNDIYITGSTGLQANKGDYIYVFANADLGSGNMKGSYTLTAKIRE